MRRTIVLNTFVDPVKCGVTDVSAAQSRQIKIAEHDPDPLHTCAYGKKYELVTFPSTELIELDDWGFPIVRDQPDAAVSEVTVRRSIAACPTLALRLEPKQPMGKRKRVI